MLIAWKLSTWMPAKQAEKLYLSLHALHFLGYLTGLIFAVFPTVHLLLVAGNPIALLHGLRRLQPQHAYLSLVKEGDTDELSKNRISKKGDLVKSKHCRQNKFDGKTRK